MEVVKAVDKASGYATTKEERNTTAGLMSTAYGANFDFLKYPFYYSMCINNKIIVLNDQNQTFFCKRTLQWLIWCYAAEKKTLRPVRDLNPWPSD